MIKTAAFVIIVALRLIYQPTQVQQRTAPFASPKPLPTAAITTISATFIGISGIKIDNKIILKWIIGENQDAWCFEVERSADGKNFIIAPLVFGTDNYEFYKKTPSRKITYPIKPVGKDKKAAYSPLVEINPNV